MDRTHVPVVDDPTTCDLEKSRANRRSSAKYEESSVPLAFDSTRNG